MGVKLSSKDTLGLITPDKLKDGQLAIIRANPSNPHLIDKQIVMRHGHKLLAIGCPAGESWSETCNREHIHGTFLVEVLPDGTQIEVENNQ